MRSGSLLLVASTLTLATITIFACSSSDTPAVTDSPDTGGAATSSSSGDDPPPDDGTSGSSGTSGTSGTSGGTSGTSGGTSSGDGGGTSSGASGSSSGAMYDGGGKVDGGNAGTLCLGGSIPEAEANDTEATANTLPNETTSFCGKISAGTDMDFATFVWPAGKTSSYFSTFYSNSPITVTITADGVPVQTSTPPMAGKKYVLKVTAAAATDYRVEVEMKP